MSNLSQILSSLANKDFYFYLSKENVDWTSSGFCDLKIHCDGKKLTIPLIDDLDISYIAGSFYHFLNSKNIIFSWNAKEIFSYIKGKSDISFDISNTMIYDLSLIFSYFSIEQSKPQTFAEAVGLLKNVMSLSNWNKFKNFYEKVYYPLICKVLPDIETNCIVNNLKKKCVYPTYIIEGQANGRLKTIKIGPNSYNPHSIGEEERAELRPKNYDEVFVYFDYKNMEVNVLQWLSKDKKLKEIVENSDDIYKEIWKKVIKQEPNESHRLLCKNIFLPVVFGQGYWSLSKKLKISEKNAARLIDTLVDAFPVAFDWVNSQQVDSNKVAMDVFGRIRKFEDEEQYKIKNFCIQSPASMICLRKLVKLHQALLEIGSLCFHVHDGYCVLCKKNQIESVFEIGTKILEEEDELFPELYLKTTCYFGNNLNNMTLLQKDNIKDIKI